MDLQDFYLEIGADYADVMRRLGTEVRIKRFLAKLTEDKNFALLETSLQNGDWDEAFRAVHSIKGICLNLSLSSLQESSIRLTENLRGRAADENTPILFEQMKQDYETTMRAIGRLLAD